MDTIHDMGGMHGFGPVVTPGCDRVFHAEWERRAFALVETTGYEGLVAGHFRETIERIPLPQYLDVGYYGRWLVGLEERLVRAGTLTRAEIDDWQARLEGEAPPARSDPDQRARIAEAVRERTPMPAAPDAAFAPGHRVRIRRMRPVGHTRCPRYLRGAEGVVERVHGLERLPDALARGEQEVVPVYLVAFRAEDLFGSAGESGHTIVVDVYEPYMEAA